MSQKKWEIHAAYGGEDVVDNLGKIMSDGKLNPFTRATLLSSALATPFKETGRSHYRYLVQKKHFDQQIKTGLDWLKKLKLERSLFDAFSILPAFSFALEIKFRLAKPYLSRDDDAFYVIDNPVRKDRVFKVPLVAPSTWKGGLRAAATERLLETFAQILPTELLTEETEQELLQKHLWPERAKQVILFGNEKENQAEFINRWLASRFLIPSEENTGKENEQLEEKGKYLGRSFEAYLLKHGYRTKKIVGHQGRLSCFPTFFDSIGLEIINPHDRARRVGKDPILLECVPAGAIGVFRLLYVPYDFPSSSNEGKETSTLDRSTYCGQIMEDMGVVAEAVCSLLSVYGFGAKTSSGFGLIDPKSVSGNFQVNCPSKAKKEGDGLSEQRIRRLLMEDPLGRKLRQNYFENGMFLLLADEEIRRRAWTGKEKADYKKLKPRVLELSSQQSDGPEYPGRTFSDLDRLPDLVCELAEEIGGDL